MKEFKKRVQQIKSLLGIDSKVELKNLDEKVKSGFIEKYQEVFGTDMLEDYNASKAETDEKIKAYDEALSAIAETDEEPEEDTEEDEEEEGKSDKKAKSKKIDLTKGIKDLQTKNAELEAEVKEKKQTVLKLSKIVEEDNPKKEKMKIGIAGVHSKTHLFGIDHAIYSRDKRWNEIMVNPKIALVEEPGSDDHVNFVKEVASLGNNLAKVYGFLQKTGKLAQLRGKAQFDVDFADLTNAGLGDQHVVLRQTALISRIQELPNIYNIFPRRFGVQDRELMTNAFFGEFSQAWQTGAIWKGDVDLQPEEGYVDDAMFKTLFQSMKWLERRYIGYLNQEGSDPMKWSMIEWCILEIATKLMMEQYERRILGVFVEPVATQAGHYLHASTGFIYTVVRYMNELKLMPFTDPGFDEYDNTDTNFVDVTEAFFLKIKEVSPNFDEKQNVMLLNANHKVWYRAQLRAKRALQNDFTGIDDSKVPDTDLSIVWVPNMGNIKLIVVTKPGNFQMLENLPGEMLAMKFKDDMEALKAWSVWKEGCAALFVGKQFTTPALLLANNFALQEVFCNKPVTSLAADAVAANGTLNFWFKTGANTGATDLTDITGAVAGKAYIIECGSLVNATTITKDDKFDGITDDFTPAAVGDYLMVVYDVTAKEFFELERRVNGVRTINKVKQPNMPGHGGR